MEGPLTVSPTPQAIPPLAVPSVPRVPGATDLILEPSYARCGASPAEQLDALGELVGALSESHSLGKIFSLLARRLKALLDPDVVQVWMVDREAQELHQVLTLVDDEHRLAAVLAEHKIEELATSTFSSAEAVRTRQIVVRRATEAVPARTAEIMAAGRIEMTLSIPLLLGEQIHGVVNMMFRHACSFEVEDLRFFDALGRTVSVAIQNAELLESISRERRWLRTILEELPTAVIMAEGDEGRLTHTNKAFQRMLGAVDGMSLRDIPERFGITDPRTGAMFEWKDLALARALFRGEASSGEFQVRGDDG
ncbi:MAG: GAF domain-containing protein, partial [Gemmatimonadetes bacterium]|nr:GAF domain-containing protein [Gemmatimonadota bacterium]